MSKIKELGKSKVIKSSTPAAVRGGSGHMVGKQHVGTQASGITSTKSGPGGKFAAGGSAKMAGKQSARPAKGGGTTGSGGGKRGTGTSADF